MIGGQRQSGTIWQVGFAARESFLNTARAQSGPVQGVRVGPQREPTKLGRTNNDRRNEYAQFTHGDRVGVV